MASTDYQPPNLASILQTLAAYAPPPPQPPSHPPSTDLEEGEYDPSDFQPSSQPPQPLPPQPIQQQPSLTPTPSPSSKASVITTWPPALRHTTHLLSTQPALLPRLRHLIRSAHAHERQWWDGRLALQQRLSTRDAGRRKISSVLASLGGGGVDEGPAAAAAAAATPGGAAGEAERELRAYDRKVFRAYGEMVKATGEELGRLGVPFFGVKEGLVVRDGEGEVGEGKVGEGELERLKGRMVEFLEDMVKE